MVSGSSPDRRHRWVAAGVLRGATPATASTMARMCSGVVPQQPPTMLTKPDRANSPSSDDMFSGVSS